MIGLARVLIIDNFLEIFLSVFEIVSVITVNFVPAAPLATLVEFGRQGERNENTYSIAIFGEQQD